MAQFVEEVEKFTMLEQTGFCRCGREEIADQRIYGVFSLPTP